MCLHSQLTREGRKRSQEQVLESVGFELSHKRLKGAAFDILNQTSDSAQRRTHDQANDRAHPLLVRLQEDVEEGMPHWRERERRLSPEAGLFYEVQENVNADMRQVLVGWLAELVDEFRFTTETFFLAVNYLDRFLSCQAISRKNFQLLGVTCLWVAAKFEEVGQPPAQAMVQMTDNMYTCAEMYSMERQLLAKLHFELSFPTALRFLHYYCVKAGILSSTVRRLAECLLELSLLDLEHLEHLPSTCAAAALFTALNGVTGSSDTSFLPIVTSMAKCEAAPLMVLAHDMHGAFVAVSRQAQPCLIYERFKVGQLQAVAAKAKAAARAQPPSTPRPAATCTCPLDVSSSTRVAVHVP